MIIKSLGLCDYQTTWEKMIAFTQARTDQTPDEIWCLMHPPIFTQGLAGKPEHVRDIGDIPLINTDRGGQVTYHGPGQLVVYLMLDLNRRGMGIRRLVRLLEQAVIDMLAQYQITAVNRCDAPGVYVSEKKIASIGLRVKKNCTYHGIALNVNMDLSPFSRIHPCGFSQLQMTQIAALIPHPIMSEIEKKLLDYLREYL